MKKLTVMIVDDEPLAREGLRRLLKAERDFELVGEAGDGVEALSMIANHRPDVLFLDVQMPGLDGFGVVSALPAANRPAIIFVTAFDKFALDAFSVHALDYLLKPVDEQRFRDALRHARERIGLSQGDAGLAALLEQVSKRKRYPERLMVRDKGAVTVVVTDEIEFIEAAGDYVRLHITGGESLMMHETLQKVSGDLHPEKFVRIHRSTVVHADKVKELRPMFRGDYAVILKNGKKLTLSRRYRQEAFAALERGDISAHR